jgi:hypothetical protein
MPMPRIFITISATKIQVVTLLIDSRVAAYLSSIGYLSIDKVTVLSVIDDRMSIMKYWLLHILPKNF